MRIVGIVAAFEEALRDAEKRHKAHIEANPNAANEDWVPFYAQHLVDTFQGVRVGMNAAMLPGLPTIANVKGTMTTNDPELSNRKWTPVMREGPCVGYGCDE